MQRRTLLTACAAGWALPAAALAEPQHAVPLATPIAEGRGKLIKVFSYDCPSCYRFDAGVDRRLVVLLRQQHVPAEFELVPAETKAKFGATAAAFFAWCHTLDVAEGRDPIMPGSLFCRAKDRLFFAYHRLNARWSHDEATLIRFLCRATDLEPEAFTRARTSPEVMALTAHWRRVCQEAHLKSVPAYILDGRYLLDLNVMREIPKAVDLIKELMPPV